MHTKVYICSLDCQFVEEEEEEGGGVAADSPGCPNLDA